LKRVIIEPKPSPIFVQTKATYCPKCGFKLLDSTCYKCGHVETRTYEKPVEIPKPKYQESSVGTSNYRYSRHSDTIKMPFSQMIENEEKKEPPKVESPKVEETASEEKIPDLLSWMQEKISVEEGVEEKKEEEEWVEEEWVELKDMRPGIEPKIIHPKPEPTIAENKSIIDDILSDLSPNQRKIIAIQKDAVHSKGDISKKEEEEKCPRCGTRILGSTCPYCGYQS